MHHCWTHDIIRLAPIHAKMYPKRQRPGAPSQPSVRELPLLVLYSYSLQSISNVGKGIYYNKRSIQMLHLFILKWFGKLLECMRLDSHSDPAGNSLNSWRSPTGCFNLGSRMGMSNRVYIWCHTHTVETPDRNLGNGSEWGFTLDHHVPVWLKNGDSSTPKWAKFTLKYLV